QAEPHIVTTPIVTKGPRLFVFSYLSTFPFWLSLYVALGLQRGLTSVGVRQRVARPEKSANSTWRSAIMRKLIGFALLFGMFSLTAFAQENAPKAEFFGGYQYTRFDGGLNANGWDTALTGNLNRWFGVTGDFSGAYKTQNGVSFNNYTYTFGPVVSLRQNRTFTPFAHFLAGGFHSSASFAGASGSGNGFA